MHTRPVGGGCPLSFTVILVRTPGVQRLGDDDGPRRILRPVVHADWLGDRSVEPCPRLVSLRSLAHRAVVVPVIHKRVGGMSPADGCDAVAPRLRAGDAAVPIVGRTAGGHRRSVLRPDRGRESLFGPDGIAARPSWRSTCSPTGCSPVTSRSLRSMVRAYCWRTSTTRLANQQRFRSGSHSVASLPLFCERLTAGLASVRFSRSEANCRFVSASVAQRPLSWASERATMSRLPDDTFLRHFIAIVSSTAGTSRRGGRVNCKKLMTKTFLLGAFLGAHTLCGDSQRLRGRRRTRRRPRL